MSKRARRKNNQNQILGLSAVLVILVVVILVISGNSSDPQSVGTLPREISVQEAYQYRENGAFILDVRTQEEWDAGHIPGATLIPLNELPARVAEVPEGVEIVVVCRSGNRSQQGRDILLNAGFPAVTSMAGGVIDWQAAGYPFE